ncbi:MAG TPA: thiolase family protein [Phycisphaerales bacterium]|nr:thiolase family protein [Phycisphaerales bacterium]
MSASTTPVILAAKRTPIGRFFGGLSKVHAPLLGSYAMQGIMAEHPAIAAAAKSGGVDEVIMGCVLQAGLGQAPARQAALKAGLPDTQSAVTVNKVCGSGLQAVMQAAQSIKAGDNSLVFAGGFENMTRAPFFAHLRDGAGAPKFGPTQFEDHMQHDGLVCPFEKWVMGSAAEHTARSCSITRADQDRWAARSNQFAAKATAEGWFKSEIVAVTPEQTLDKKSPGVATDEGFRADTTTDTLGKLRPVFDKEGTITAGNASQISDGGAAVCVASLAKAEALGVKPIAKIVAYHTSGVAPKDIFTAPALAVPAVVAKAGLKLSDIDLFELNEAFCAQVLQNMKAGGIPEDRVNVAGGATALGHPIGASGARCLVTLVHQLRRTGGKRGVVALCLGGGNAVAMVVEV